MAAMEEKLSEMAAMMLSIKKRQDEEFAAMKFYSAAPSDSLAVMTESDVHAREQPPTDPCMEVTVKIGDTQVRGLLDTGCTTSAMDRQTVDKLGSDVALWAESALYRKADGSTGMTTHRATAAIRLLDFSQTRVCMQDFRVAKTLLYPIILGRDFMRDQKMILNFETGTIEWDGITVSMQTGKLSARASAHAAVLQTDTECRAEIQVEYHAPTPLEDMVERDELTLDEFKSIMQLIREFETVFSGALGTIKRRPYVLPLRPDAEPVTCRPYPVPRAFYDAFRNEIQRLIDIGVLKRDPSSEWASPAFDIPTKDGSVRLVCDFRKLNKMLRRNYYPTKDPKEMMRSLTKLRFKSVFDVPMSCYACLLAELNRRATAITTPLGKFVFLRLPMGVSTAPDEFQAAMDDLLGDVDYVRVYLDDILVFSSTFEEHLLHLREVFTRLQNAGPTLHPKKCKVCAAKIEYLSYQLTTEGIAAMPKKVEAISAIAPPKTRRELRRFVGMVNFYRDMMPRRAEMLAPLTQLTSPTQPFRWTQQHDVAFERVKQCLREAVMLVFPRLVCPTMFSRTRLSCSSVL